MTRDAQAATEASAPQLGVQVTWEVESGVVELSEAPCIDICGVKDESREDGFDRGKDLFDIPSCSMRFSENQLGASALRHSRDLAPCRDMVLAVVVGLLLAGRWQAAGRNLGKIHCTHLEVKGVDIPP